MTMSDDKAEVLGSGLGSGPFVSWDLCRLDFVWVLVSFRL